MSACVSVYREARREHQISQMELGEGGNHPLWGLGTKLGPLEEQQALY